MINARTCRRFLAPLAFALAAGCAPAYHSYSGCHVDCKYCVPPPLPYAHYKGCLCHSCAASKYLSVQPRPLKEKDNVTDGDQSTE